MPGSPMPGPQCQGPQCQGPNARVPKAGVPIARVPNASLPSAFQNDDAQYETIIKALPQFDEALRVFVNGNGDDMYQGPVQRDIGERRD
jgi:hypothetical protein